MKDPHYQLKLLKMHNICGLQQGFFKSINRQIPARSRSLYTFRNDFCHYEEIDADRVAESIDYAEELLLALGDTEGAKLAKNILEEYASYFGLEHAEDFKRPELDVDVRKEIEKEAKATTNEAIVEKPSPIVEENPEPSLDLDEDISTTIGEYEPWQVEPLGIRDHLDHIRATGHSARVRSAIQEVVDAESPISMDRLTRLVAYGFGFAMRTNALKRRIQHQVTQTEDIYIDDDKFVWSSQEDYESFVGFRSDPDGYQRHIGDISPREIANAIQYVEENLPNATDTDKEALRFFNRTNRTARVNNQLAAAKHYQR